MKSQSLNFNGSLKSTAEVFSAVCLLSNCYGKRNIAKPRRSMVSRWPELNGLLGLRFC